MKNPNGYGSITKMSGKRRNPWAVVLTTGWTEDGKQKRKYLGYFRTRADAVKALANYNDRPYDLEGFTFAEVFEKWKSYKYPQISRSNQSSYNACFNKCTDIHDAQINSLDFADLQEILDPLPPPTAKKMKILFNQMWSYAEKRNIVARNFAHLLEVKPCEKSDLHMRYTDDEIETLWKHSDDEYVQIILMMIYSGVRPGELLALKRSSVDLKNACFTLPRGKNINSARVVPIHERTLPFFASWYDKKTTTLLTTLNGKPIDFTKHSVYTRTYYDEVLNSLGILYQDGKKHHPDDARHTFTTLWTAKKLSEIHRRKIQGHSGKGVGEEVYTHLTVDELREELNKL